MRRGARCPAATGSLALRGTSGERSWQTDTLFPAEHPGTLLSCRKSGVRALSLRYHMNRQELLDLYFLEARSKLIDLAAFFDRLDRAEGKADFRLEALQRALEELRRQDATRAEGVLLSLSDPTAEPIPAATTKAACGAWPGRS